MKIIISHDIDHLSFREHLSDLFILKYIVRAKIEWLAGKIGLSELYRRLIRIFSNKLQNLDELMDFDKAQSIPSTFFIGVNQGKGLNYPAPEAEKWIRRIMDNGFEIGVHGVNYENINEIRKEYERFIRYSGKKKAGTRMHYLRMDKHTCEHLSDCGYIYDSSLYEMKPPHFYGTLWEFPLHIMDSYIIEAGGYFQKRKLAEAREVTRQRISLAAENKVEYLTVVFHDIYYADTFITWKQWYEWLISYLKKEGFEFISYDNAVKELNTRL
ncbi:MAG: hypothetical protein NTU44_19730 [Bacteroidetes bacterium]|nr:hypothetical protein [Bacteroidota bacterium]